MKINHALKKDHKSIVARAASVGIKLPIVVLKAEDRPANWDLGIGVHGTCYSAPTPKTASNGCKPSSFGDVQYLVGYLAREGDETIAKVPPMVRWLIGIDTDGPSVVVRPGFQWLPDGTKKVFPVVHHE